MFIFSVASIGLGLGYVFGGNSILLKGILALAIALLASYLAVYLSVGWRTRLLVRKADRVFGRIYPPGSGPHPPADTEPGTPAGDDPPAASW